MLLTHLCNKNDYSNTLIVRNEENCLRSRGHIFILILKKLGQNLAPIKSQKGSKMIMSGQKLGLWVES